MKATGIVRKVDQLGRITIPRELFKTHNLKLNETPMEIYVEAESIILKKYEPCCVFCGEATVEMFKGKYVCKECRKDLEKS